MNLTSKSSKPLALKKASVRLSLVIAMLIAGLQSDSIHAGVYPNTPTRLWPNGIIPVQYDNDPSINLNQRLVVLAAMNAWAAAANLTFVVRTNEPDYLFIRQWTNGPSYPPPAGYRAGTGAHTLNLNFWGTNFNDYLVCTRVFGMAHELGHVLGLSHTHQSQSRSNYFIVRTNLINGGAGDWAIDTTSLQWPRSEPDIDSIMSYPLCTLSTCGFSTCNNSAANMQICAPILLQEPYASQWATNLATPNSQCPPPVMFVGQRNHLSVWDQAVMSYLYPQPSWRFAEAASTERREDGSFHYPAKTFDRGEELVPSGGTLFMEPSTYPNAGGVHTKAMIIRATRAGRVIIRE